MKSTHKSIFIPGLGERAKHYPTLAKHIDVYNIDWNHIRIPRGQHKVVAGFSLGACFACEYAITNKVDTLILCSMTPGIQTLEKVKAKRVIFLIGEKEQWALQDFKRLTKTLKCPWQIMIIKKGDHRISGEYLKQLIETVADSQLLSAVKAL